jgi:non-ribosomal peptide synthetase component E (peptide arylation enzyme)
VAADHASEPNTPGPTLVQLQQFLREQKRVAVYKLPEYLMLLPALPRNAVGKVLKRELRAMAERLPQEVST